MQISGFIFLKIFGFAFFFFWYFIYTYLKISSISNTSFKPSNLNLAESAYFVAYGIFLQLGQVDVSLYVENFSFENTGLLSDFSEKWNQEFTSALVKAGNYKIEKSSVSTKSIIVRGNYWNEAGLLKVNASAIRYNKVIAASKGSITLSWLNNENIDHIPIQIKKNGDFRELQTRIDGGS